MRITIRFPLGVYHARSTSDEAEWPPSPLRLIGALLAAAHGRRETDPEADRALIQRLCEAPSPLVVAPGSVAVGELAEAGEAVRLRGATRWVPRNYLTGPLSPRNIGRERAPVSKAGVAIGDRQVAFIWPELELDRAEMERLSVLASDVTFLGTTRSPAILEVDAVGPDGNAEGGSGIDAWMPATAVDGAESDVTVRVPNEHTIAAFDRRHDARRSKGARVQKAGMVPEVAIGTSVPYVSPRRRGTAAAVSFDPRWWGEMIVLEIDRDRNEVMPKAPAAYLLARAVRVALLGAFGEAGTPQEAPLILRGRDADPHCAIVPMPSVWGEHASGLIRGVTVMLPHEAREPNVAAQMSKLEYGLSRLVGAGRSAPGRYVKIPGAGQIWLKAPDAQSAKLVSLREQLYRGPASTWVSITPVVHSRWRKGGIDGLLRQVSADCEHVGLPAPTKIELLRAAGRRGGADRVVPAAEMPEQWRGLLAGPTSHLRITFPQPIHGPVLLGRARHFGLGLCVPDVVGESNGDSHNHVR